MDSRVRNSRSYGSCRLHVTLGTAQHPWGSGPRVRAVARVPTAALSFPPGGQSHPVQEVS